MGIVLNANPKRTVVQLINSLLKNKVKEMKDNTLINIYLHYLSVQKGQEKNEGCSLRLYNSVDNGQILTQS